MADVLSRPFDASGSTIDSVMEIIRAAAKACVVGIFVLLRMSEFAQRDVNHVEDCIIRRMDVTFFVKGRICA